VTKAALDGVSAIESPWTERVRRGEKPDADDIRRHLRAVHERYAGFAESCALNCRDQQGRNSYEWLLEVVDPDNCDQLLDLGCGGGALVALCHQRFGDETTLIGVDMSPDELALARERLPQAIELHQGVSQNMSFMADASVDVVLCHWALTLMAPVEPALQEVNRILRPGGVFAAIVDGWDGDNSSYAKVSKLIYGWVESEFPDYSVHELGDPRVRRDDSLRALVADLFPGAEVAVEPRLLFMEADARALAEEAANFFYASYVLSAENRLRMLEDLTEFFRSAGAAQRFSMPVNRLVVSKPK